MFATAGPSLVWRMLLWDCQTTLPAPANWAAITLPCRHEVPRPLLFIYCSSFKSMNMFDTFMIMITASPFQTKYINHPFPFWKHLIIITIIIIILLLSCTCWKILKIWIVSSLSWIKKKKLKKYWIKTESIAWVGVAVSIGCRSKGHTLARNLRWQGTVGGAWMVGVRLFLQRGERSPWAKMSPTSLCHSHSRSSSRFLAGILRVWRTRSAWLLLSRSKPGQCVGSKWSKTKISRVNWVHTTCIST